MLTKEECEKALVDVKYGFHFKYREFDAFKNGIKVLEQLINEHFELVEENERLSTKLVECQRVCQVKQERINELAKGTVSYVD